MKKNDHSTIQKQQWTFQQLKDMVGFPGYHTMQEKYGSVE